MILPGSLLFLMVPLHKLCSPVGFLMFPDDLLLKDPHGNASSFLMVLGKWGGTISSRCEEGWCISLCNLEAIIKPESPQIHREGWGFLMVSDFFNLFFSFVFDQLDEVVSGNDSTNSSFNKEIHSHFRVRSSHDWFADILLVSFCQMFQESFFGS